MSVGLWSGGRGQVGIMPLSESNRKVLGFIAEYQRERGISPSLREIMEGCGYRTPAGAFYAVHRLMDLGYLKQKKGKARALQVSEPDQPQPRTNALSEKNRAVLRYILDHLDRHGYAPTLGEIARRFKHARQVSWTHVDRLVRLGYLHRVEGVARGIVVVDRQRAVHEVNNVSK